MSNDAGKGDDRRPCQTSREEEELRYSLARGEISRKEYDRKYKELLKEGKITRSGKVIRG